MAGLIIKLTQDRLTEEKEILLRAHKGLIEMGPKNSQSSLFLYFLDKETVNL